MEIQVPLLLNLLKELIDIDFNDDINPQDKEKELKNKIRSNEKRIKSKVLELVNEREALMDKIEDLESTICNIEHLLEWSKLP